MANKRFILACVMPVLSWWKKCTQLILFHNKVLWSLLRADCKKLVNSTDELPRKEEIALLFGGGRLYSLRPWLFLSVDKSSGNVKSRTQICKDSLAVLMSASWPREVWLELKIWGDGLYGTTS